MITEDLFAAAALITSLTGLLALFVLRKDVKSVHSEVTTLNGKTVGVLLDNQEGRRIVADVPIEDQTSSDRHYVEALEKRDQDDGKGSGKEVSGENKR